MDVIRISEAGGERGDGGSGLKAALWGSCLEVAGRNWGVITEGGRAVRGVGGEWGR